MSVLGFPGESQDERSHKADPRLSPSRRSSAAYTFHFKWGSGFLCLGFNGLGFKVLGLGIGHRIFALGFLAESFRNLGQELKGWEFCLKGQYR